MPACNTRRDAVLRPRKCLREVVVWLWRMCDRVRYTIMYICTYLYTCNILICAVRGEAIYNTSIYIYYTYRAVSRRSGCVYGLKFTAENVRGGNEIIRHCVLRFGAKTILDVEILFSLNLIRKHKSSWYYQCNRYRIKLLRVWNAGYIVSCNL